MLQVSKTIVIVSPDPIPNNPGIVTEQILAIQQEILLINKHTKEHVSNRGEIRQPEGSCIYCQRRRRVNEPAADRKVMARGEQGKNRRKVGTLNEIERRVDLSVKNGCVVVPRTWAGKRVRIVLVEDDTS